MYMEPSSVWLLGHAACGLGACRLTTHDLTHALSHQFNLNE